MIYTSTQHECPPEDIKLHLHPPPLNIVVCVAPMLWNTHLVLSNLTPRQSLPQLLEGAGLFCEAARFPHILPCNHVVDISLHFGF